MNFNLLPAQVYDHGRVYEGDLVSEDIAEISDQEFDRYMKKKKEKDEKNQMIFYSVVACGIVIYALVNLTKKNKS